MPGLVAMQGLRAALNAALFRTGDQSRDFAVVLATNRPGDLDPAVLDRMDEALEFPLPGPDERARILQIYLDSYIAKAGSDEGAGARLLALCTDCVSQGSRYSRMWEEVTVRAICMSFAALRPKDRCQRRTTCSGMVTPGS